MAKRFADTRLSREAWFRKLSPEFKCVWRFLCDECDEAGVWSVDEDALEFYIGAPVVLAVFIGAVNADGKVRVKLIGQSKLFLADFCVFQYGELSESCNPHKKVIKTLRRYALFEEYLRYLKGYLGTQQEEEEEKEKEEDKETEEEEGGVGGENLVLPPAPNRQPIGTLSRCIDEWKLTLKHFDISRNLIPGEDLEIGRASQKYGVENVCLAFQGARKQKKSPKWDPAEFVNLTKYLDKTTFNRLVNLGAGKENSEGIDWDFVFSKETA